MKLTIRTIVWVTLTAALLAGCGGANLTATVSTQPPAQPTEPPALPSAYPISTSQPEISTAPAEIPTAYPAAIEQPAASEQPAPTEQPAATGQPAPVCTSPATLTPSLTEGPYFKAGSPQRPSLLEAGMPGTKLVISGYVLTPDCQPIAGALLDFWQADASGQYDNTGYTLRGHQFTDLSGYYQLETVVPGLYPGRTEHIHVKVQAQGGPILTTQLFFPDQAANQTDAIFDPGLVLPVQPATDGLTAAFNFIVNLK